LHLADGILGNKWPSFLRCLSDPPLNHDNTGPDISRISFAWCMAAISWREATAGVAARHEVAESTVQFR